MDGFRNDDRAQILACLTDDVEWYIPGGFDVRGKQEFAKHIRHEGFIGNPEILSAGAVSGGPPPRASV